MKEGVNGEVVGGVNGRLLILSPSGGGTEAAIPAEQRGSLRSPEVTLAGQDVLPATERIPAAFRDALWLLDCAFVPAA